MSGEGVIGRRRADGSGNKHSPGTSTVRGVERHRAWLELKPLERHTDPFDNVVAAEDVPKKNARTILYTTSRHAQRP